MGAVPQGEATVRVRAGGEGAAQRLYPIAHVRETQPRAGGGDRRRCRDRRVVGKEVPGRDDASDVVLRIQLAA